MRPDRIQNPLAFASRVFEPNRRQEVLEKAISRIRIVILLWETNKRLKRARVTPNKRRIKNRSIFFPPCLFSFLVLVREPVIQPRGTVDIIVSIFLRIRPSTPARKIYGFVFIHFRERFQNLYGFGGSDPRVSVDARPKRIKKYTDSNESALVWTGPKSNPFSI